MPEPVIRRRFWKSLVNFDRLYRPVTTSWRLYGGDCMNRRADHDIARALRDGDALDRAIVAARRRVIRQHRLLRVPLAIWRDGQVVEVASESIELPAEVASTETSQRER